jgi:putative FmdB family regulatory protein
MPVYVYQCDSCGVTFERLQSFNEDPLTNCPECDGHVHRVIQPVGIVFKGSGFYVTDNRAKSPTSLPGEKKEVTKESESSSSDADSGDS